MAKHSDLFRYLWLALFLGFFVCCCQVGPDADNPRSPSLTASFTYSPASPLADQAVQFTDTSTGSPTSWQWSFGDGETSTSRNPAHTFSIAGAYTVKLTVANASGSKNVSKTITVVSGLAASFTYSPSSPLAGQAVQFTDTSTGAPTAWQWNFGDGSTSTARNPSHVFDGTATYTVTLRVSNNSGSKSTTRMINVLPASTLIVSFTYSPSSPNPGQAVQFTDTSTGAPTSWQWDFGDGATGNVRNPSHVFSTAASYTVTLTLRNDTDSNSASRTINVMPAITLIPPFRLIDWSNAGVWYNGVKGIPTYPVGIDLTGLSSYGGYALDKTGAVDSTEAINAAMTACPTHHAVLLGPGAYLVKGIRIPSYKVLRGAEPFTVTPLTTLIQNHTASKGTVVIDLDGSPDYAPAAANIVGVAVKGSDTVTVDSVSGLSVGDLVIVDELNDSSFVTSSGTEDICNWCSRENGARSLGETKCIKAIDAVAKKIQFERPLYYGYSRTPQVMRRALASGVKVNAGVESLRIIQDGSGVPIPDTNHAVSFAYCKYCWANRIEVDNHWYRSFQVDYYALGCEVRECFIHNVPEGYSIAGNYAIGILNHATDCLVENNITYHVHSVITLGSGGGTGNVIGYNFCYNSHHDIQTNWWIGGNGTHGAHPYMNLIEGNYIRKIMHDRIHGSSSHNVWFRNRVTAVAVDPSVDQEMSTINIASYNYFESVIGNVLHSEGLGGTYESYPCTLGERIVWKLGFASQNGEGSPTDPTVASTLIRHGNYNYITHSTIWDAGISDHALPNSMYLTAKPTFFGGLSWPAFGPDLNPMESYIPAKYRFDAGTYFADPPIK